MNLLNILRKFENEDKITKKCSSIHQGHLYTYPDVFETGDIFSSLFEKIRVFQSFSPVHKKTLIRWKDSSVPYGACAVWRMTLPRFVVFFFKPGFFLNPFGAVWFVLYWALHISWLFSMTFSGFQDLRFSCHLKKFSKFPCFGVFLTFKSSADRNSGVHQNVCRLRRLITPLYLTVRCPCYVIYSN